MFKGRYIPPQRQIVLYGDPLEEMLPRALSELWARQTVLVSAASVAGEGAAGGRCSAILGEGCTDRLMDIRRDAPAGDVLRIAAALRHKGTEAMVAVGGGSVAEAAKAARILLTNNVAGLEDLPRLETSTTTASPRPYMISVPTTLSGAEYTPAAGFALPGGGRQIVRHSDLAADIVCLDPTATLETPDALWFASGLRAVDHAIETWCASAGSVPLADADALQGLRLLTEGLRSVRRNRGDLEARQACQLGAWLAIRGAAMGVPHGPSHAIGRPVIRDSGLPQGVVSAILLPHVLRHTGAEAAALHAPLSGAMGAPGGSLADAVAALAQDLGLPATLGAAGADTSSLDAAAQEVMTAPELQTGGRAFPDAASVLAVLRAAA